MRSTKPCHRRQRPRIGTIIGGAAARQKQRHSRSFCQRPRGKIGIIVARDEEGGEEEKIIDRVNPVGTSLSAIRGRAATATAAEDDRDNDAATTTTASESE